MEETRWRLNPVKYAITRSVSCQFPLDAATLCRKKVSLFVCLLRDARTVWCLLRGLEAARLPSGHRYAMRVRLAAYKHFAPPELCPNHIEWDSDFRGAACIGCGCVAAGRNGHLLLRFQYWRCHAFDIVCHAS